jgi:hypothetical protein
VLDLYDGLAPEVAADAGASPPRRRGADVGSRPALAAAAVLLLALGGWVGRWTASSDLERQLALARIGQPSAAERLQAAVASAAWLDREPLVLESLLDLLERDPSPNVRMAVVEALYRGGRPEPVEERFGRLLAAQDSPLLKIALIELAADRGLRGALDHLRPLADASADEVVRERARWAVGILSWRM